MTFYVARKIDSDSRWVSVGPCYCPVVGVNTVSAIITRLCWLQPALFVNLHAAYVTFKGSAGGGCTKNTAETKPGSSIETTVRNFIRTQRSLFYGLIVLDSRWGCGETFLRDIRSAQTVYRQEVTSL